MTPRVAVWITRGVLALAAVMIAVIFLASVSTPTAPIRQPIVIGDLAIPADCAEPTGDPAAKVTRDAWCGLQQQLAEDGALTPNTQLGIGYAIAFLICLLWIATGGLIVSRQHRNLAGWMMLAIGLAAIAGGFGSAVSTWAIVTRRDLPALDVFAVLAEAPFQFGLLIPLLFLLYPDGRAPERWRWLTWVFAAAIVAVAVGTVFAPDPLNNLIESGILYENPIGIAALGHVYEPLSAIGGIVVLLAALATVLALRSRYRRTSGDERQQMRWLVAVASFAGILLVVGAVLTFVASALLPIPDDAPVFIWVLIALAVTIALGIPAAYLIAIFRYGLWDLDIVIKKAVLYVVVAALVLVTFGLVLLLFGRLFVDSDRALAVAAGIAGLLAWPAVRLARRLADRIVYRGRATPYEALASFRHRMSETYSTEDVLDRTAQLLASATGAERAVVWLRIGREMRPAASAPAGALAPPIALVSDELPPFETDAAEPVRDQGELLGALAIDMPANDPLDQGRERILRDLAAQAGLALRNVRLIEELRASRQRLVAAQDEERRKLERNIHDGVQQQLVALAVRLKLADTMIDRDPAKAHEALAALQTEAGTTLDDLRDLARGIYPPLLADQGLVAALEAQARKAAVPTTVDAAEIGRYPQGVESAVYFCSLEALNNIAKYANATHAVINLAQDDGNNLSFTVTDDGDGFDADATNYGTGLQGMADRLDAIGGSLDVTSALGSGTTVSGRVPVHR